MQAQVHIPSHSRVSSYITAIWETVPPGVSRELILPKGVVEMVFNLADPMQGILPHRNRATAAPDCFLQGLNTQVVDVRYCGRQHLFGICLHPHRVRSLLGLLSSECKNRLIDLTLVRPMFRQLWHRLNEAAGFWERVAIIENEFPMPDPKDCVRTRHFSELFSSQRIQPLPSIDALSRQLCYSSRQLSRKAQDIFGISTEELILHKKFRDAVSLIHRENHTLTDIAYETGFYDQAHFCRIFKNYTGLTAKQYQLRKSGLPFHVFS